MSKKVVFLMRELSGYFVSCIQNWRKDYQGEVWVVYWPTNQEAPFQWTLDANIYWVEKKEFLEITNQEFYWHEVHHIFVAGWGDQEYNGIVKSHLSAEKTILFDTQWKASWKMHLGRFWLYFKIIRHFDSAWVPGLRQRQLASKLFFKKSDIFDHFYVGDQLLFDQPKLKHSDNDTTLNIVFAGRLIREKGILPLIQRFIETIEDNHSLDWRLHICGTGPLTDDCPLHQNIIYHGFVQPRDLALLFQKMDLFVLPSLYEPWGVVVHEAAFAGLPLLVSDAVGSADAFLENGRNGWLIPHGDTSAMIEGIDRYAQLSLEQKQAMSNHSKRLARSVVLDSWAQSANQIINDKSCAE